MLAVHTLEDMAHTPLHFTLVSSTLYYDTTVDATSAALVNLNPPAPSLHCNAPSGHLYPPPTHTHTGRLSINCPVLNGWLKGGLLVPGVTEIVGTSAAGKTQICMQLSLCAQLPAEQGGLDGGVLTTREGGRKGMREGGREGRLEVDRVMLQSGHTETSMGAWVGPWEVKLLLYCLALITHIVC